MSGVWCQNHEFAILSLTRANSSRQPQHGAGNWKAVEAAAGDQLNHRTVVDLKDKWRNLENSGKVLRSRNDQRRAVGLL